MVARKPPAPPAELLACRPQRAQAFELEGERVVVLRPRFIRGPFARWLQPRLKRPHFRVRLDELGSFIWQHCDGQTTVFELAAALEAHFGQAVAPVLPRLQLFLYQLEQSKLIQVQPPAGGDG